MGIRVQNQGLYFLDPPRGVSTRHPQPAMLPLEQLVSKVSTELRALVDGLFDFGVLAQTFRVLNTRILTLPHPAPGPCRRES